MPNGDLWDGFFYPTLTPITASYNVTQAIMRELFFGYIGTYAYGRQMTVIISNQPTSVAPLVALRLERLCSVLFYSRLFIYKYE